MMLISGKGKKGEDRQLQERKSRMIVNPLSLRKLKSKEKTPVKRIDKCGFSLSKEYTINIQRLYSNQDFRSSKKMEFEDDQNFDLTETVPTDASVQTQKILERRESEQLEQKSDFSTERNIKKISLSKEARISPMKKHFTLTLANTSNKKPLLKKIEQIPEASFNRS